MSMAFFLSGCASIVSTSTYPVHINSIPSGANVTVTKRNGDFIQHAVTPTVVTLKSSRAPFVPAGYRLSFSKDGYQDTTVNLNARLDPWYLGNILFGGLVGLLVIDPLTGAMWELEEDISPRLLSDGIDPSDPALLVPRGFTEPVSSDGTIQWAFGSQGQPAPADPALIMPSRNTELAPPKGTIQWSIMPEP